VAHLNSHRDGFRAAGHIYRIRSGTYTVTVRDANGCTVNGYHYILPPLGAAAVGNRPAFLYPKWRGITITASGELVQGTMSMTYWMAIVTVLTGGTHQASNVFNVLATGKLYRHRLRYFWIRMWRTGTCFPRNTDTGSLYLYQRGTYPVTGVPDGSYRSFLDAPND